ncbi:MAG TPA: hypothetical protein VM890_10450 [Longimicrobium sp.]|jgi:hypothetical protein|nr:hypothetical protein [Longimicrobium sp.]
MRKLKLEVEELAVETFELDDADRTAAGTVRAHAAQPGQAVRTIPVSNCFWSACATCGIYC